MKKQFSLLLALALLISLLSACGGAAPAGSAEPEPAAASSAEEAAAPAETEEAPAEAPAEAETANEPSASEPEELPEEAPSLEYPLVTDGSQSIKVWVSLPPHVAPYMEDVAQSAAYRAASEATGVQMIATTISVVVEQEQFQLMCASGTTGEYDAIVGASRAYGSADAALEDEILMDVAPYTEEFMPDFHNFLQNDEEIRKVLTTDSGAVVDIAGRGPGGRPQGFGIRKDWLDKSGMEIPKTYDELHDVLTEFKNAYNCPQPLLMFSTGFLDNDFLCSGMGMTQAGFYIEDDTVKFAYLEDSFREYAELVHQWYDEGLISPDFISNVQGMGVSYDPQMQDGTVGVFMTGADIFSSASKAGASDPDWEVVPMADMTRTGTETITLGRSPNTNPLSNAWDVTTGVTEDRIPYVLGFINWFFTEEGSLACNFGIEGEGFEYDADGVPRLTETVTNNPEGYGSFVAEAIYLNWNAPFCQDPRYYESIYDTEAQASTGTVWNSNRDNSQQYHGDMTAEEMTQYNMVANDISTYISTMAVSFMTGAEDIETQWDTFVSTIESMDIAQCIEIKQNAYDRYLQR